MSQAEATARRRGGRIARQALRAAPPAEDQRAVRGGLEGGRYSPLNDGDIAKIHAAALTVLETVGMADATPSCIEMVTNAGGKLTDDGRLLFPRALVEDTIANANRRFVLHGQDPKHDMEPWGDKVYFGLAGFAGQAEAEAEEANRSSHAIPFFQIERERFLEESEAPLRIQCLYRGYCGRKIHAIKKREKEILESFGLDAEDNAAVETCSTTITAEVIRRRLCRNRRVGDTQHWAAKARWPSSESGVREHMGHRESVMGANRPLACYPPLNEQRRSTGR